MDDFEGIMLSEINHAAAAKLLQSCLTLCDPIDGSPPGSPVPGILQARTLEWVAISFSNAFVAKNSQTFHLHCVSPRPFVIIINNSSSPYLEGPTSLQMPDTPSMGT